jgi:hypothetical protein
MKRNGSFKKITIIGLVLIALLVSVACSSQSKDAELVTIQEQLPLAAQSSVAAAKEKFENGGSVNTTSLQNGSVTVNTNLAGKGIVGIRADVRGKEKCKVKVCRGENAVYYNIAPQEMIKVPLQMGSGAYCIELYQNISGTEYARLFSQDLDVELENENDVFLLSNEIVNYEDSENSMGLAAELTQNTGDETEKLNAIYDYIVRNMTYDYDEINRIDSTYIPDIDTVLESKKGICYDYAAVMASLLREAGIPAKLLMGYRSDTEVYHAWNQAMVDGRWVTVDATWDSVSHHNGQTYSMEKDEGLYSAEKYF